MGDLLCQHAETNRNLKIAHNRNRVSKNPMLAHQQAYGEQQHLDDFCSPYSLRIEFLILLLKIRLTVDNVG